MTPRRTIRAVLLPTIAAVALAGAPGHAAGPNLLPNAGFEKPATQVVVVPNQPLLPEGWAFEGAAILFDHTANEKKSGSFGVAISGSLSVKREVGFPPPIGFVELGPLNTAKDETDHVVSVTPYWRTALPIAVQGSKSYTLRVWTRQTAVTELADYGAVTKIRWLDANNVPIGDVAGPRRPWEPGDPTTTPTDWRQISASVTSPANARAAIVMLGQADDIWISQVIYDDAYFGLT